MMTDRELLERAAKAAGMELENYCTSIATCYFDKRTHTPWNPLTNDGDALRLAVKLGMMDDSTRAHVELMWQLSAAKESDTYAATRRAIVRAAAAMSKQMPLDHNIANG